MGTLFVVGTPIGNLEDITLRALRVLRESGLIAAEDTRITRRLLARHSIDTPMVSFHEHSARRRIDAILSRLADVDVALVTDAGTPGISDPGAALVAHAVEAGFAVVPVPGPSAVATALSASGLPGDAHVFVGFLPRRRADRREMLSSIAPEHRTVVAFEAPHRVQAALADLVEALGPDRRLVVARELTKAHEEIWRGTSGEATDAWASREARGEFVLLIGGADGGTSDSARTEWTDEQVRSAVVALLADGCSVREASRRVARECGRTSREVYLLAHRG